MEIQLNSDALIVTIDATIYPEVVLLKCLYWYSNTFQVDLKKTDSLQYEITMKAIHQSERPEWNNVILKLKQDLIDFKLRQYITDETKTIRELIIAKAFVHYSQEEGPVSEISDPVGFTPQSIKI